MPDTTERLTLAEALAASPNAKHKDKKRDNPEERAQIALFEWVRRHEGEYPLLRRVRADRAGVNIASAITRNRMREMGGRTGVWDVFVDVVYFKAHKHTGGDITVKCKGGLYIEMKSATGTLTDEQRLFRMQRGEEFVFYVAHDAQSAAIAIKEYLEDVSDYYLQLPVDIKESNND